MHLARIPEHALCIHEAPSESMLCQPVLLSGHVLSGQPALLSGHVFSGQPVLLSGHVTRCMVQHSVDDYAGIALLLGDYSEPTAPRVPLAKGFQATSLEPANGASLIRSCTFAAH